MFLSGKLYMYGVSFHVNVSDTAYIFTMEDTRSLKTKYDQLKIKPRDCSASVSVSRCVCVCVYLKQRCIYIWGGGVKI